MNSLLVVPRLQRSSAQPFLISESSIELSKYRQFELVPMIPELVPNDS